MEGGWWESSERDHRLGWRHKVVSERRITTVEGEEEDNGDSSSGKDTLLFHLHDGIHARFLGLGVEVAREK